MGLGRIFLVEGIVGFKGRRDLKDREKVRVVGI